MVEVVGDDPAAMRAHARWLGHEEAGGCTQLDLRRGGKTERGFHATVDSLIASVLAHPEHAVNVGINPRPAHWVGAGFRECGADAIATVTAIRIDIDCCRPIALATAELVQGELEADARRRLATGKPTLDLPPVAVTIAVRCAASKARVLAGVEEQKAILRRAIAAACQAENVQLRPELLDRLVTCVNRAAASQPTTEAEYQLAIDAGKRLSDWAKAQGWGAPLVIGSGNGCHVWLAIDAIQLDPENREAIALGCAELERLCRVEIETDGSPLRVDPWGGFAATTRLAGCPNRKGTHTADRSHRISYIVQGSERTSGAALAHWLASEGGALLRTRREEGTRAEAERKARLVANPQLDGSGLRNLDKRIDGAVERFIEKHPLSSAGHDETLRNLLLLARMLVWELDLPDAESRFRGLVEAHCDADHWSPRQLEAELAKALSLANGAQGARDGRGALIERWAAEDEREASARHSARRRETRERIVAVGAASKIDVEGGGDGGLKLTDLGNAERFVKRFGDRVRYCPPRKSWLVWDSRRWAWDETGEVMRLAKKTARGIYGEASHGSSKEAARAIAKHATDSEKVARLQAMVTLAQSEEGIPVMPAALDSDPWKLNVQNGTIDLKTGALGPHHPGDLITKLVSIDYGPAAQLDIWDRFLHEATGGDRELATFLQRFAGYCATGLQSEKRFFFIYSRKPDTGKSTFADALRGALGDYASDADFETWLVQSATGGNRGDIARLTGARLVISVEVRRRAKFDTKLVKAVTGGDPVTVAAKYEKEFTYRPQFKILLAANDAPVIRDDDRPMFERCLRIPFDVQVPPARKDPDLKRRLADPTDGGRAVLRWIVDGCLAWQREGLGVPPAVRHSSEAYLHEMNTFGQFIEEACLLEPTASVSKRDFRDAYDRWTKESGVRPLGARDLKDRLVSMGVSDGSTGRARIWKGIRLGNVQEAEADAVDSRDVFPRNFSHETHTGKSLGKSVTLVSPVSGELFDAGQPPPDGVRRVLFRGPLNGGPR